LIASLSIASCGDKSGGSISNAQFTAVPCSMLGAGPPIGQAADSFQCGYLMVPENRRVAGGRTIQVAVAILKSTSPNPQPDPLVYLNGGPGISVVRLVAQAFRPNFAAPVQAKRDIILMDQRGSGASLPAFSCPEYERALAARISLADYTNSVAACHDRLASEGSDLTTYTSADAAADIRDLMRVLGYTTWNIYGQSYGSRLALTVMRDTPPGMIRRVVLDATYPVQTNLAPESARSFKHSLDAIFATCQADQSCNHAYPDLENQFYSLIRQFNATPTTVQLRNPFSGQPQVVLLDGQEFMTVIELALTDYTQIRLVPSVIKAVASGNNSALAQLPGPMLTAHTDYGLMWAVDCSEEVPFYTPDVVNAANAGLPDELQPFAVTQTDFYVQICGGWGLGNPPPVENEAVRSDIPTLLMVGQFDPAVPRPDSDLAAATLSKSTVVELPGFGHTVLFFPITELGADRPTCGMQLLGSFLDNPTAQPDTTCIDNLPATKFAGT
jgi:pimeloyl-ACP methyl ester carboxylesterase